MIFVDGLDGAFADGIVDRRQIATLPPITAQSSLALLHHLGSQRGHYHYLVLLRRWGRGEQSEPLTLREGRRH